MFDYIIFMGTVLLIWLSLTLFFCSIFYLATFDLEIE